jgi:hypothetical protein
MLLSFWSFATGQKVKSEAKTLRFNLFYLKRFFIKKIKGKTMKNKTENTAKQKLLIFAARARKIQNDLIRKCDSDYIPTINEILKDSIYEIKTDLKSFKKWKEVGKKVKKGEKGYLFFTRPLKAKNKDSEDNSKQDLKNTEQNQDDPKNQYDFFGHCYLFASHQVE